MFLVRLEQLLRVHPSPESAETNIIFLAYLIARRGSQSVHRAFPKVKIVTAAIDTGLEEMRVPMISPSMGEAVAEADFATRAVSDNEDADGDLREDELRDNIQNAPVQEGYRLPVKKGTEELMFSRKTRADAGVREKRAWAISPGKHRSLQRSSQAELHLPNAVIGMGHIG